MIPNGFLVNLLQGDGFSSLGGDGGRKTGFHFVKFRKFAAWWRRDDALMG